MVLKPRFICRKCLRIAADKKNLCKGKKLKAPEGRQAEETAV